MLLGSVDVLIRDVLIRNEGAGLTQAHDGLEMDVGVFEIR